MLTRFLVICPEGVVHPAPTFVLSALDPIAPFAIRSYVIAANERTSDQNAEIRQVAVDFEAWRNHPANINKPFDPFAAASYEDEWIKKAREAPGAKVALYMINKGQHR